MARWMRLLCLSALVFGLAFTGCGSAPTSSVSGRDSGATAGETGSGSDSSDPDTGGLDVSQMDSGPGASDSLPLFDAGPSSPTCEELEMCCAELPGQVQGQCYQEAASGEEGRCQRG